MEKTIKEQLRKAGIAYNNFSSNEVAIVCPKCKYAPPGGPQATFNIKLDSGTGQCQRGEDECGEKLNYEELCEKLNLQPVRQKLPIEENAPQTDMANEQKKFITLKELMDTEFSEHQFIVEGLLPTEGITIISGEAATFKSTIVAHMMIQISQGEKVFGKFQSQKTN